MSITTDSRKAPEAPTIEDRLRLWGASRALSPKRAAEMRNIILTVAREADEASGATDDPQWLSTWLVQEMATLRLALQRSLGLDEVLVACGPEALRSAIGPLSSA